MAQQQTVPFGFKDVAFDNKDTLVGKVFSDVASRYDLMNDLMSGGIHRLWKNFMLSQIIPHPNANFLDVAGGTGDIAFRILKKFPQANLTLSDINPDMLEVGQQRASKRGLTDKIQWICDDACNLKFPDQTFTHYTIAFGLRNVTDIPAALSHAHRVLRPGGQFLCLEFSEVIIPVLQEAYEKYSFKVIPKIGQLVASNADAYQYLVESIARFPNQQKLSTLMTEAGFKHIKYNNLTGGIAALHIGWRI